jgi:DNA-binding GntR family transcriptional regulator
VTGIALLPELDTRRSIRSQVIDELRAALVSGQMMPGEVYSAPLLAARFGVSATPVREAMLELVKEGFVTTVRNKGFRVRELSERELDEVTDLRMLIEVPATLRAGERATARDLAQLRPLAEGVVAAARRKDLIGYVEHDRQFHAALLALAGNAQLVTLVTELRGKSRLYGLGSLADRGELVTSAVEHVDMLRCIRRHDHQALESLIRTHIGHVRGSWAGRSEGGGSHS